MVPSIAVSLTIQLKSFIYTQLDDQIVLFQTIQFSISHFFAHSLNVNGNEGVLHISQNSKAGAAPSDCFVSYSGHSLGGVLPLCRDAVTRFYCITQLGWVWPSVVIPVRVLSMSQIDLFANYLYWIGILNIICVQKS